MADTESRIRHRWGNTGVVAEALALWAVLGWSMLRGHVRYALLRGDRQLAMSCARTGLLAAREAIRCGAALPGHLNDTQLVALLGSGDAELRTLALRITARGPPE